MQSTDPAVLMNAPPTHLPVRPEWLASFAGKRVSDGWKVGGDVGEVSGEARSSAEASVEGTRSLLVLLSVAEGAPVSNAGHH